jgi:outer membrane usher protein
MKAPVWFTKLAMLGAMLGTPCAWAQSGAVLVQNVPAIRETLASVTINGVLVDANMTLLEVTGLGLLMSAKDYQKMRLINVKVPEVVRGEEDWVALGRLKGIRQTLNQRTLALELIATPDLFASTNITVSESPIVKVSPIPGGAYLNYDVIADSVRGTQSVRGLFEGVGFSRHGSLVSSHLLNHFSSNASNTTALNATQPSSARLESYFQKDFVDSLTRLKLGDSVTNPGAWGRANRFGGLQFGTDYSLNPRFVSAPLLDFRGQVSVPSTVDLFINNGLVRRFEVAPGPFSIAQIPVVTGNGDARLVVRDSLGRDVVINQPFFTAPAQLRSGLSQYSFEVGALRQEFGLQSNRYGAPFLSSTYRYGVSDSLTVEGRLEHLLRAENGINHLSVGGLSAVFPLARGHYLAPSVAYSDSSAGQGTAASIQYGYSGTLLFYGLRADTATENFRQIGYASGELPQQHRFSLSVGTRIGYGSLSLALTDSLPRPFTIQSGQLAGLTFGANRLQVGNITYSTSLGRGWSMATGVSRVISGSNSTLAFANLNYSPSAQTYVSANVNSSRLDNDKTSQTTGSIRAGQRASEVGGIGYEGEISNRIQRLTTQVIARAGELSASIANENKVGAGESSVSTRINARGAIVITADGVSAARPINNGFILVKAPALANLPVRTGAGLGVQLSGDGTAVLTRITPYYQTEVQVIPEKAPIDVTIDQFSTRVTPASKAGVIAILEVRKTKAITFRVIDEAKNTLPTGTKIEVYDATTKQKIETASVGLDGLVYIKDIPNKSRVFAKLRDKNCSLNLPKIPNDLLPDLGDIACTFD